MDRHQHRAQRREGPARVPRHPLEAAHPADGTTSVEDCVALILAGFAKRKSRVHVLKGVMISSWTKALTSSPLVWPVMKRLAGRTVPQMEKEVDALGRFHHSHVPRTSAP